MRKLLLAGSVLLLAFVSGCAHYQTPGGGVSIPAITDGDVADIMARKPAATFPALMVVARVQASGYVSRSAYSYGTGNFSVLAVRSIDSCCRSIFARRETCVRPQRSCAATSC